VDEHPSDAREGNGKKESEVLMNQPGAGALDSTADDVGVGLTKLHLEFTLAEEPDIRRGGPTP
jgi:hypothetical protein